MPWKDRYTISDERTVPDSEVRWPDGKRCCFRVVVDLSPACGPEGLRPQDLATPDAYYGMQGWLDPLRGALEQHRPQPPFPGPAATAESPPRPIPPLPR